MNHLKYVIIPVLCSLYYIIHNIITIELFTWYTHYVIDNVLLEFEQDMKVTFPRRNKTNIDRIMQYTDLNY